MSDQTGDTASLKLIDRFVGFCAKNKVKHVEFFGGEPLYFPDLFEYAVVNLRKKIPAISLGVVTNGTCFNDNIFRLIKEHSITILLSLDGGKARHDALRGGYQRIRPWFSQLQEHGKVSVACQAGVVRGLYSNIAKIWKSGFKRVFINVIENYGWYSQCDLREFEKEYEAAIMGMLRGDGILSCALKIHDGLQGSVYDKQCGITRRGLACDWKGFLYPCHRAVELGDKFIIGDIDHGVDREAERVIRTKILKECFHGKESRNHELVSFCPVAIVQNQGGLNGRWNQKFCEMIALKNKLVAKHYYEIRSFQEKWKP